MLKIRLRPSLRRSKNKRRNYRIVLVESGAKRNGEITEDLGYWQREVIPAIVRIDLKKLNYWTTKGAQITPAVKDLIE